MNGINTEHTLIIAEAGVNHNGDINTALQLVKAAKEAGADAVKFQTFKADRIVTFVAEKASYQKTTSADETQYQMLKRLELSQSDHLQLLELCQKLNIEFLSTPFDFESADLLADLGIGRYKIPSGEITNIPFLRYIARKGRPMVLSTGASNLGEVSVAVESIYQEGNRELSLLHCVSQYPARFKDTNLKAIRTLATAFRVPVGYSDHTLGIEISIAAVALGAKLIEKHFTLDRAMVGPDHQASIEPGEFSTMVNAIRHVEEALGDGIKSPADAELDLRHVIRRSLVYQEDLQVGELITPERIAIKRPATGISPLFLEEVTGLKLTKNVIRDTALQWEDFK